MTATQETSRDASVQTPLGTVRVHCHNATSFYFSAGSNYDKPDEVCGMDISHDYGRCTNGRCWACHRDFCTGGGSTSPGHGRGVIATPFSAEAIRARLAGGSDV